MKKGASSRQKAGVAVKVHLQTVAAARPGCGWMEPLTPPNCKPLARYMGKAFNRFFLSDKILCRRISKIHTEYSPYCQNGS